MKIALMACLAALSLSAQESGSKPFAFRGQVDSVDPATKRLTVTNDPIEGWMGTMTMAYSVDDPEVLSQLKAGDRITATVYQGDLKLYRVQVVTNSSFRLEDLEAIAIANNPTMAQVEANLRAATALSRQAGLYPNPTVGYSGDEIRGGYEGGGEQGGFISQTIVLGGKLRAARRVAEIGAQEAATSSQLQRLRILTNVRSLFYRTLAAQRLIELRQNLIQVSSNVVQTSHQLQNVGQADRPDILQAEVEEQQANLNLHVAQKNQQACWRVLAAVIGKPAMPVPNLGGDLEAIPELSYDESLVAAINESPEVKLTEQEIERAEALLNQARKAPIPDLQVTGTLMQSFEPLDPTRKPAGVTGGAEIGVQLPIFNRNQGNIAAAKAEIESGRQELARVKLQVQRDLASLFRDYDSARLIAQQYKTEILPRAEQAYQLYQANYQRMAGAYAPVLISQRTLFQLEADYIQALENVWQSALLIRGFGLSDGLMRPGGPE
jgi:outer membrane protein, heavy metal efflux system